MTVIIILLALSALYCGGMWLWLVGLGIRHRKSESGEFHETIERYTFHLGLCFILSVGFLGLILE